MTRWQRYGRYHLPYRLELTDGTTTIDLVYGHHGFTLAEWTPAIADLKEGGLMLESPLGEGAWPIGGELANSAESITVLERLKRGDTPALWNTKLRGLLRRAAQYTAADSPVNALVYLVWQDSAETNTQYAWVVRGRIEALSTAMSTPMRARPVQITLERGQWLETPPGQAGSNSATAMNAGYSALYDANSETYGNALTDGTANPSSDPTAVLVGNKWVPCNISHIYLWDASGSVWSANKIGGAVPFDLIQALVAQTNSAMYFGISTADDNAAPFDNLAFDLSAIITLTGVGSALTGTWEYWDGAAWSALANVADRTDDGSGLPGTAKPFTKLGTRTVSWTRPDDWATGNLFTILGGAAPAVTGWWARFRFTITLGGGGAVTDVPAQQNSWPYTTNWNWQSIDSAQIPGELGALLKLLLLGLQDQDVKRLTIGTRTTARGSSFNPVFNASDAHNELFVTCLNTADTTFIDDSLSPTGRCIEYTPAGASSTYTQLVQWKIASTQSGQYTGAFRVFVRIRYNYSTPAFTDYKWRLDMFTDVAGSGLGGEGSAGLLYRGYPVAEITASNTVIQTLDFGRLRVPDWMDFYNVNLYLSVYAAPSSGGAAKPAQVYDLILIPADEWVGTFYSTSPLNNDQAITIDPIRSPRAGVIALQYLGGYSYSATLQFNDFAQWLRATSRLPQLRPNATQRLYFLAEEFALDSGPGNTDARIEALTGLRASRQARYLHSRGNQ